MPAADSIFTRIIRGEIPCHKVFENASVFAFLDINPLATGHTLVVPRRQVVRLEELPADEAAEVGRCLPQIAGRIMAVVGAEGWNLLQNNGPAAGQVVPHVHFHIIPRRAGDGLGFVWRPQTPVPGELAALASRITSDWSTS